MISERRLARWMALIPLLVTLGGTLLLYAVLGALHAGDSPRYLDGAERLLRGEPLQEKASSYIGYVAVVAFTRLVGGGTMSLVLLQTAFAGVATLALYDLGRRLAGRSAGFIAAILFAANPEIARWHLYVLTDSLYISLVICTTWLAQRAAERRGAWYPVALLVAVAAALIRPHGWLLPPILLGYWISRAAVPGRVRWGANVGLVLVVLALLLTSPLRGGAESQGVTESLFAGEVIWGYPGWRMEMPPSSGIRRAGLAAAVEYAVRHPLATIRLGSARIAATLAHVRPFYSPQHNLVLLLFLPVIYALAIVGLHGHRRDPLAHLAAAVIAGHLLVVAGTFADWDGRFLLYFLPLVLLLSGAGASRLVRSGWPSLPSLSGRSKATFDRQPRESGVDPTSLSV